MDDFVLVVGVSLLTGFAAGLLVSQLLPKNRRSQEVHSQLEQSERKLQNFRAEVNTSFQQTAELLDDLARSYREVHNHLVESADELLEKEQNPLRPLPETQLKTDGPKSTGFLSPPLDYAPKSGALAEDYGIEKVTSAEPSTPTPDLMDPLDTEAEKKS